MCGGLLPLHTPAWGLSNLAATPIPSLISSCFSKNRETVGSPASGVLLGVGPPGQCFFSCLLSCPGRPPRAGRCVPSKIRVPSTPSQRTCSQVLCPLLGKAPWEAFLTFRPVSAQSWPHAHENHFLPGCLPSWAPWVQPGWRLCTPDPEAM